MLPPENCDRDFSLMHRLALLVRIARSAGVVVIRRTQPQTRPTAVRIAAFSRMASDAAAAGAAAPKFRGPKPFEHAEALDANFDKEQFTQHLSLKALRVPARYTGEVLKTLNASKVLLELPKIKGVQRLDSDPDHRYMIFAQRLTDVAEVVTLGEDADTVAAAAAAAAAAAGPAAAATAGAGDEVTNWCLPDAARARLRELGATVVPFPLSIGYEHMSAQAVLRALLPATIRDKDIPSSFEMAGHLAHLNLLVDLMPYRKIIGESWSPSLARVAFAAGRPASSLCAHRCGSSHVSCVRRPRHLGQEPAAADGRRQDGRHRHRVQDVSDGGGCERMGWA